MEPTTKETILWVLGIGGTLLIGIVTNALWDWLKENVTYSSSRWPKLKGQWSVIHSNGTRTGERVLIQQQFGAKFRGELHTPDPSSSGRILIQIVRGEFLDRYHALFTMRQNSNDFTEIGAGLITIQADAHTATGKSVFFGVTAPTEEIANFSLKKEG
ncbi:hypothetical protein [Caballeronia grimmiae]|uniref:hypothetical protein n=1 Tax=Caballeronia grimmiae TaxID=1071679 RepID=UPI0038BA5FE3